MSPQCLDHLIMFLPLDPSTNLPSIPASLSSHFTLTPGGFHADGATSNILILLSDGCYIELISFVDPTKAPSHWWGPDAKHIGWKDWCLTNSLSPEENYQNVQRSHNRPMHGGRNRADGIHVQWAVTFPKGEKGGQAVRGRIPFFCHDVTPRDLRVPLSAEKIEHPCGALGVRRLTVIVKDEDLLEQTRSAYAAGITGAQSGKGPSISIGRVNEVKVLDVGAEVILRLPKNGEEMKRVEETGFWYGDVVLGARASEHDPAGSRIRIDAKEGDESVGGLWIEYV